MSQRQLGHSRSSWFNEFYSLLGVWGSRKWLCESLVRKEMAAKLRTDALLEADTLEKRMWYEMFLACEEADASGQDQKGAPAKAVGLRFVMCLI